MTKILHVIDRLDLGGAQKMLHLIAESTKSDYEVYVCVLGKTGPLVERIIMAGISVEELGYEKNRWNPMVYFRLKKLISDLNPDILHLHLFKSIILGAMIGYREGIAIILHDHTGIFPENLKIYLPPGLDRIYFLLFKWSVRKAKYLVALNKHTLENHKRLLEESKRSKVVLIPDAISIEEIKNFNSGKFKKDIQANHNCSIVGFVGRLDPEKDCLTFIKAAAEITRVMSRPVQFLIVGSGSEEELLRSFVRQKKLDNVKFLGFRPDVARIMWKLDVLVLTSKREEMGIVLLEAMAAGCPIVATKCAGPVTLIDDEVDGLLVNIGSDQEVAVQTMRLLEDKDFASALSRAAYSKVCSEYTIDSVKNQLISMYESI